MDDSSKTFTLVRRTPEGVEKTQGPFTDLRSAARAAGMVLHDNARTPKAEAQRFSASLASKPLGTDSVHMTSGYVFRVEKTV